MPLKFFQIHIRDAARGEAELNGFLSCQRVLTIQRRFVDLGENSFWSLCVDYLSPSSSAAPSGLGKKPRVDYRETLSPQAFAVFAKLRDLRKEIALAEAVPVYLIFTNEQLAEMVRRNISTNADLEAITGVGDARVTKYGARFLEVFLGGSNRAASGQSN